MRLSGKNRLPGSMRSRVCLPRGIVSYLRNGAGDNCNFMRKLIFIFFVVWARSDAARGKDGGAGSVAARGQGIEKIKITDLESYIAHSDHPLIINFWATYCTPCIKEIPYIQSTVDQFKDQKVEMLLVSLDKPVYYPGRISDFAQKNGYKARILWLNETDADYFCPKVDARWTGGIPCSLF